MDYSEYYMWTFMYDITMRLAIQAEQRAHRKPQHQTVHVRNPRARTMRSVNRNS